MTYEYGFPILAPVRRSFAEPDDRNMQIITEHWATWGHVTLWHDQIALFWLSGGV